MKCLVTGATGFVGSRLVPYLIEQGHDVLAYSRTGGALENGFPTIAVDLASRSIDEAALRDVDVVVHLAGIAHQQASVEDYDVMVVEATAELAQRAARAGVRRFVYFSSVKAMGASATLQPRSEQDCTDRLTPYGAAKKRAEESLCAAHASGSMAITIIRPALIYGTQSKGNLALLDRAARWGLPRPPEQGLRSMVSLDALLALLQLVIERRRADGVEVWIACDDHAYSTAQLYDLLRTAMNLPPRQSRLPLWLWRVATGLVDTVKPQSHDPLFDKLFAHEVYSNHAASSALGWVAGSGIAAWADSVARLGRNPGEGDHSDGDRVT